MALTLLVLFILFSACLSLRHPVRIPSLQCLKLGSFESDLVEKAVRFDDSVVQTIISSIDPTKYWFMFPVAVTVATCAITTGIGGAALFGPIFLIILPTLGPDYSLSSPAAAVGIAILTETFGFSTRNLALVSVPVAYFSSMMVDIPPLALKIVYTILMLSVSAYMFGSQSPIEAHSNEDNTDFQVNGATPSSSTTTTITDSHGNVFKYPSVKISPVGAVLTSIGGAICGAIGVGIGEVILPQLLNQGVPIAVAAATSTLVVTLTCAVSAGVQVSALVAAGGVNAIPWSLVMYIVPGVIIGAQVAAALQGSVTQQTLRRAIGTLFGAIGIAFTALIAKQSGILP